MVDAQPTSGDARVADRRPCLVSRAGNHRVERLRNTRHLAGIRSGEHLAGIRPGEGTDGVVRVPEQWTLPGGITRGQRQGCSPRTVEAVVRRRDPTTGTVAGRAAAAGAATDARRRDDDSTHLSV